MTNKTKCFSHEHPKNTVTGHHHSSDTKTTHVPTTHDRPIPNELICHIIHQHTFNQKDLYEYSLVNKQFNAVINPVLWQSPQLDSNTAVELFIVCLANGQQRMLGHHVRTLDLSNNQWTDIHLTLILPYLGLLEHLVVGRSTSISAASLRHLPRHCPHLSSLSITKRAIDDTFTIALAQHCHKLRQLRWIDCPRLPANLSRLRACSHLDALELSLVGTSGSIPKDAMVAEFKALDQLHRLKINKGAPALIKSLMTILDASGTQWPYLTHVTLDDCCEINDATLVPFIQSHLDLEHITLIGGGQWTDTSLDAMAALAHLTELRVNSNQHISAAAVRRLIGQCRTLATLTVSSCKGVSNADFAQMPLHPQLRHHVALDQATLDAIRLAQWLGR